MLSSLARLKRELKSNGHSYTKTRAMVFQAIEQNGPLSMHRLSAQLKHVTDRASVYRTVALFEKLGIVQRLQLGWKYQIELSETFSEHHHHIQCIKCGTIVDYHEDPGLARTLSQIARTHGYTLTSHQIELQGLCPACQKNLNPDA